MQHLLDPEALGAFPEDARRAVLGAQVNVLSLERERAHAWISLYRAAGGGWTK